MFLIKQKNKTKNSYPLKLISKNKINNVKNKKIEINKDLKQFFPKATKNSLKTPLVVFSSYALKQLVAATIAGNIYITAGSNVKYVKRSFTVLILSSMCV